jgi:hypothetical protein
MELWWCKNTRRICHVWKVFIYIYLFIDIIWRLGAPLVHCNPICNIFMIILLMLSHFYLCSKYNTWVFCWVFNITIWRFFFPSFNFVFCSVCLNFWKMHLQVLFCSTETGRSSFVRQLEPDWHIDTNPEILFQLAVCFLHMPRFEFVFEIFFIKHHLSSFFFWQRFIKYQLHVSPTRIERTAANVFSSPSLEQFFGCIWCIDP